MRCSPKEFELLPRCVRERIVADRIKGRVWAEEVMEQVLSEDEEYVDAFLTVVMKHIPVKAFDKGAFNKHQMKLFGQKCIEFGHYKGTLYKEVPLECLEWLSEVNRELSRYVQARQRDGK